MNKMKKPIEPRRPPLSVYEARVERRYIYSFEEPLTHYEDDRENEEEISAPIKHVNDVDLAWLLTLVPEGVGQKEIKIEFSYTTHRMGFGKHYVKFY